MKNSIEYLLAEKLIQIFRLNCKKDVRVWYIVHYPTRYQLYIVKSAVVKTFYENHCITANDTMLSYKMTFLNEAYAFLECEKLNNPNHKQDRFK